MSFALTVAGVVGASAVMFLGRLGDRRREPEPVYYGVPVATPGATDGWSPVAEMGRAGAVRAVEASIPPTRTERLAADHELHERLSQIEAEFLDGLSDVFDRAFARLDAPVETMLELLGCSP